MRASVFMFRTLDDALRFALAVSTALGYPRTLRRDEVTWTGDGDPPPQCLRYVEHYTLPRAITDGPHAGQFAVGVRAEHVGDLDGSLLAVPAKYAGIDVPPGNGKPVAFSLATAVQATKDHRGGEVDPRKSRGR